jgi:hypothetical protein
MMPAWPTLFPLFLEYKRDYPLPHGGGESEHRIHNDNIANEYMPNGLKGRDMYWRYLLNLFYLGIN